MVLFKRDLLFAHMLVIDVLAVPFSVKTRKLNARKPCVFIRFLLLSIYKKG